MICDAPFMFRAVWNVLYPFIDPVTCKKIRFVTGSDEQKKKILTELFDLKEAHTPFSSPAVRLRGLTRASRTHRWRRTWAARARSSSTGRST